MPLTSDVAEDVYDCVLNALDHGLESCALTDKLFHKTTPDLPFGFVEVLQLIGYMQRHDLFASGFRLEKETKQHYMLLVSRSQQSLRDTIEMMYREVERSQMIAVELK
jgi:hypothetical protein